MSCSETDSKESSADKIIFIIWVILMACMFLSPFMVKYL